MKMLSRMDEWLSRLSGGSRVGVGVLAFFGAMGVFGLLAGKPDAETASNDLNIVGASPAVSPAASTSGSAAPVARPEVTYKNTPDYVPPALHPNMTRDEQIKALTQSDPSSHGYTDSDRAFLAEHGMTPEQARAIEETMARQGYRE